MNKNNVSFYKKLLGCKNHHQLRNENVLNIFLLFYQTIAKDNRTIVTKGQIKKRKNAILSIELVLCHYLLYVTLFLNKTFKVLSL